MADIDYRGTRIEFLGHVLTDAMPVQRRFGAFWMRRTQQAFRDQGRDGVNWPARINPNIPGVLSDLRAHRAPPNRRFQSRPALMDTGHLRQSETWRSLGPLKMELGTNAPYAMKMQRGGPVRIVVTKEMKSFLWEWMKSLPKARRKAMQKQLGFIFGIKDFELNVRPRPHVLLTKQDKVEIVKIMKAVILEQ